MPVPLKIALDLIADHRIEIRGDDHLTPFSTCSIKRLDPCNSKRLTRMNSLQGRAKKKAIQFLNEQDLLRIEKAFDRMESGSFGYCVKCEAKIPLTQLEHDPAKSHCPDCDSSQDEE
jgi:DnaK suppressor protein